MRESVYVRVRVVVELEIQDGGVKFLPVTEYEQILRRQES